MQIRIYYEDTDCGGVVYYSNYLKYFERARTELLRDNGIDVGRLAQNGLLFVVARAEIDYKYPAAYGDVINIKSRITNTQRASFDIDYRITRNGDSKLLTKGRTKMAAVDGNRKPVRINEEVALILKKLCSESQTS